MNYEIKRGLVTVATVRPIGGLKNSIMGESVVEMVFTLGSFIEFLIGDQVTVYGEAFTLYQAPSWTEKSTLEYEYRLQFRGKFYQLSNVQYMQLGDDNSLKESEFSLMGTAEAFVDLLILNANRVEAGWTKGVIDATETKNLTFSKENCLRVLSVLAEEFGTEFWVEGQTINLSKKGAVSGLELAYGKGNGLYNLTRNNKDESGLVTRLYAFGGTKNIPGNYRNFSNRLKMPVATGAYLEANVAKYGIIEETIIFDDIYPRREGTVSAVDAGNHLLFTDAAIDFDVNAQLLSGVTAKITFNTGQLAGYELEITNYNHATKTFTLAVNKDEKALEIPSALIRPAIGDKYVITDIEMPQTYIDAGELEVQTKAQEHLNKNKEPRYVYAATTDKLHFKREGISLVLGNSVRINDIPTGVDVNPRIISYTRDLHDPYLYTALELSESVQVAGFVRSISKQEKIQKALVANNLFNPNTARNNWRNSQELFNMVFDPDGFFTDKIKPLSIETSMLSVGARSQQFQLNGILFQPNFGGDDHRFVSSAGTLDHFNIDPAAIKTWNIVASDYAGLANTAFYIYAKCEKAGVNGTILLSTSQFKVDQDATYYHFLVGVLHSSI